MFFESWSLSTLSTHAHTKELGILVSRLLRQMKKTLTHVFNMNKPELLYFATIYKE